MRVFILSVATLVALGCGGASTGPSDEMPLGTGSLAVTFTRVAGTPELLFSASVRVGDGSPISVRDWGERTIAGLSAETHVVEVTDPTTNCAIVGGTSKSVSIVANRVTPVDFQFSCTFQPQPRIAYTWRTQGWDTEIWTASPDGTGVQHLTTGFAGRWCPDGTRIVFSSGGSAVVMNFDGTEQRPLLAEARAVSWTGDGGKVGFTYRNNAGVFGIWTMELGGSTFAEVGTATVDRRFPAWSHDNQKIAFCEGDKLMVMNADGTAPVALTGEVGCAYPAWSPDDQEIAFTRSGRILRIGADGSGLSSLVTTVEGSNAPGYSPDGNSILFYSNHGSAAPAERAWIMDADGGNPRLFAPLPGIGVQHLRWWQD